MKKAILSTVSILLLLCVLAAQALAAPPDETKTGSISIAMTYRGETVPGGSLTLYRVGQIKAGGETYSFVTTGGFESSGISLSNLNDSGLAQSLADFAAAGNFSGSKQPIDADGKIAFRDLQLGLYLLVQEDAAEGYSKVAPFLVSIPVVENGTYVYEVDGSPKLSLKPLPTEPPTDPTRPPDLPQTGQVQWPIPVLTVSGLLLITFGAYLYTTGRKKHED